MNPYYSVGEVSAGPFVSEPTNYGDEWGSAYMTEPDVPTHQYFSMGADASPATTAGQAMVVAETASSNLGFGTAGALLSLGAAMLGAYHGYKRNNGSIGWAIGWSVLASLTWPIALPVMYAQGIGKPAGR